jgi:hypothetical protein
MDRAGLGDIELDMRHGGSGEPIVLIHIVPGNEEQTSITMDFSGGTTRKELILTILRKKR